nr:hypothetical protein GCM10020185_21340 [Pseudomonas brassicacearum subsp. brassicacearum]
MKKLTDVIVLVAGDSDFVPAAKLARMKGIDFVLDPMWANTTGSLSEHVDGLRSFDIVRLIRDVTGQSVTTRPDWWDARTKSAAQLYENVEIAVAGDLEPDPGLISQGAVHPQTTGR